RIIESRRDGDAENVRARMARLDVILGRRAPAVNTWGLAFIALVVVMAVTRGRVGLATALRIGFLGALWLPGLALLPAASLPRPTAAMAILLLRSLAFGSTVGRSVR